MPTVAQLAARRSLMARRRKPKPPKRMAEPRAAILQYTKAVLARHRGKRDLLREVLYPELPKLLEQKAFDEAGGTRLDAVSDDIVRTFGAMQIQFGRDFPDTGVEAEIAGVATATDVHHTKEFAKQTKAATGLELITPAPGIATSMQGFIRDNLSLVKSVDGNDWAAFETIVTRGVSTGLRVGDIQKELEDKLDISKRRAELLARDQTNKLFGKLTELRQKNVGVTEYTWDTSKDSRVRERHAELEGTRHRWDNPPIVDFKSGRRAHPGGDYQCRCQALPVFPAELLGTPEPEDTPTTKPPRPAPKPKGETDPFQWAGDLTPKEQDALTAWTATDYKVIKAFETGTLQPTDDYFERLRQKDSKQWAFHLRKAAKKRAPYTGEIYRGMEALSDKQLEAYKKAAEVKGVATFRSSTSWTRKRSVADEFGLIGGENSNAVIFRTKMKSGAHDISAASNSPTEAEVLVLKGKKLKVDKVESIGDHRWLITLIEP